MNLKMIGKHALNGVPVIMAFLSRGSSAKLNFLYVLFHVQNSTVVDLYLSRSLLWRTLSIVGRLNYFLYTKQLTAKKSISFYSN